MGKATLDPEERKARVRARIEKSGNLPTLPHVVVKIVEMVDDEHTTARQLGAEIAKDQVVSATSSSSIRDSTASRRRFSGSPTPSPCSASTRTRVWCSVPVFWR